MRVADFPPTSSRTHLYYFSSWLQMARALFSAFPITFAYILSVSSLISHDINAPCFDATMQQQQQSAFLTEGADARKWAMNKYTFFAEVVLGFPGSGCERNVMCVCSSIPRKTEGDFPSSDS